MRRRSASLRATSRDSGKTPISGTKCSCAAAESLQAPAPGTVSGRQRTATRFRRLRGTAPGTEDFSPGMALGANCFYSDGRIGYDTGRGSGPRLQQSTTRLQQMKNEGTEMLKCLIRGILAVLWLDGPAFAEG